MFKCLNVVIVVNNVCIQSIAIKLIMHQQHLIGTVCGCIKIIGIHYGLSSCISINIKLSLIFNFYIYYIVGVDFIHFYY